MVLKHQVPYRTETPSVSQNSNTKCRTETPSVLLKHPSVLNTVTPNDIYCCCPGGTFFVVVACYEAHRDCHVFRLWLFKPPLRVSKKKNPWSNVSTIVDMDMMVVPCQSGVGRGSEDHPLGDRGPVPFRK